MGLQEQLPPALDVGTVKLKVAGTVEIQGFHTTRDALDLIVIADATVHGIVQHQEHKTFANQDKGDKLEAVEQQSQQLTVDLQEQPEPDVMNVRLKVADIVEIQGSRMMKVVIDLTVTVIVMVHTIVLPLELKTSVDRDRA